MLPPLPTLDVIMALFDYLKHFRTEGSVFIYHEMGILNTTKKK